MNAARIVAVVAVCLALSGCATKRPAPAPTITKAAPADATVAGLRQYGPISTEIEAQYKVLLTMPQTAEVLGVIAAIRRFSVNVYLKDEQESAREVTVRMLRLWADGLIARKKGKQTKERVER